MSADATRLRALENLPADTGLPDVAPEQLWGLLDDMPCRVSYIDRERRHRYVNAEYAALAGRPADEIVGRTVAELYGEAEDARLRPDAERVLTGETQRWQGWAPAPDGAPRYIERVYKPHRLPDGSVAGFFVLVRDLTDHLRAEDQQRHMIEQLRAAIDSSESAFGLYDENERLQLCNAAYAHMYGLTPDAMIGMTAEHVHDVAMDQLEIMDGEPVTDRQAAKAELLRRMRKGDGQTTEMRVAGERWFLCSPRRTATGGLVFIRTEITELKRAEARLRESERHFRSIVEGHPTAVWVTDLETGEIVYESPAAAAMFGRDWPSTTPPDVTKHWQDPEARAPFIQRLRREGMVRDFEWRAKKADGTPFWVLCNLRHFVHEGRELVMGSMTDLTERKTAEQERQRWVQLFEEVVQSISYGFGVFDKDRRLVICNEPFAELYERDPQAMRGALVDELAEPAIRKLRTVGDLPADPADPRVRAMFESLWAGKTEPVESQLADGRWMLLTRHSMKDGGFALVRADITDLKAMQRSLQESEERFRSIAEAHPVPVVIVGLADGRIKYASPACERLWGRTLDDIVGSHIVEYYVDPAEREAAHDTFGRQGYLDFYEVTYLRADGSEVPAAITARPIRYDGEDCAVTGLFDLSEQKAAQAEIAKQRDALHQSEKLNALGALLAGISHELNNPLSVVVGQALMLEETAQEPRTVERARRIGAAADRCARIVKTFLAMARQQPSQRGEVRLNDVVNATLDLTGYMLRSADITVMTDLAANLPPVHADKDQLAQVLMNLIVNAQQAMLEVDGQRRLKIMTRYDKRRERVRLKVKDTGPGIPPDVRPRIFEPFYTTKPVGCGTGVGLAVSRGIVQAHDGTIEVEGDGGRSGASFVVELPAMKIDHAVAETQRAAAANGRRCRVLVVDDETEILTVMRDILAAEGHEVITVASGQRALELLEADPVDAILSDLRMPGTDGPGLYRALATRRPDLLPRLAFITGDTLGPNLQAFLENTGIPCLEKPFTPDEVRGLVRQMLDAAGPAR